jgi:hypothetical protein
MDYRPHSLFIVCVLFSPFVAGIFPEPDHDPVIQIANMVVRQGHHEPFLRNVFTLDTCAAIVGCQVLSFADERELLEVGFLVIKFLYKYCKCLVNNFINR